MAKEKKEFTDNQKEAAVDAIIADAVRRGINLSRAMGAKDVAFDFWDLLGQALYTLDYSVNDFIALSDQDPKAHAGCRKQWSKYRSKMTKEKAQHKILFMAKNAGMKIRDYIPDNGKSDNNPSAVLKPQRRALQACPAPVAPPTFIPMASIEAAEAGLNQTQLYAYLCRVFAPADVDAVCKAYHVGATKEFGIYPLQTAFPYINAAGACMDVKLMRFKPDGRRYKDGYGVNWEIAKMQKENPDTTRAPWCLFGEHLIPADLTAPIGIVESEKTALICALSMPQCIWVATGGESNLKPKRLTAALGHPLLIIPDRDGIPAWREAIKNLQAAGHREIYFTQYAEWIESNAVGEKDDIADILLRNTTNPTNTPTQ